MLTSFRNQSSCFLSHQYHLGGMRLWSLILDIRYNENYSSGSAHPHPTYSDPDHEHTHFSYANICFRTYDHTSFLAPVFCIRYIILIGSLFFWIRYLGAEYMLYHLGGISIMCRYFWAPMILQPLFRIRSLYVSHVLYTAYLESKGICYPIVWLLVKWALRGVYELTKAFFW